LHQNILAAAEVHNVPDDQKITRQFELFDERELAIDLAAGAAAQVDGLRVIAIHRAFVHAFPQERIHRLARRRGISGKLIAEVGERELQAIRKRFGVGDGLRQVGEEASHFLRAF
jgi:hypothetical protein